jgi:hypothetical protein
MQSASCPARRSFSAGAKILDSFSAHLLKGIHALSIPNLWQHPQHRRIVATLQGCSCFLRRHCLRAHTCSETSTPSRLQTSHSRAASVCACARARVRVCRERVRVCACACACVPRACARVQVCRARVPRACACARVPPACVPPADP